MCGCARWHLPTHQRRTKINTSLPFGLFTQVGHKMPGLELRRPDNQEAMRSFAAAAQRTGEVECLNTEVPQIPDPFLQVPGGDVHGPM